LAGNAPSDSWRDGPAHRGPHLRVHGRAGRP
jgi:hypothetical protein